MEEDLEKIRAIADYQFGHGAGIILFPDLVKIEYSKNTGRIRHIYLGEDLVASYRPNDALFTLTIFGAKKLVKGFPDFKYKVQVADHVVEFVEEGGNLFAKHVVEAHPDVRPGQELVVVDRDDEVIAVGRALLNREEMLSFETGVAIKIRRGRKRHR
jgi:7-cyano-7-deazaguanine tRNA-ribosyltransferase